jgi:sugar O-acyltransferase (sialic acid O-acetyltransferase NeuD family)
VRLAIFGTGGMGREAADIALRMSDLAVVFVVDDPAGPVDGIPVIRSAELAPDDLMLLALGDSAVRKSVAERFSDRRFGRLVSQAAIISPSAMIGEGSLICDYVVVNSRARIGRHFQANVFSQISHDCIIGDYVTFSPRATCNGWVQIDDGAFIGAGSVIRNGSPDRRLHIGTGATVGMGAVVVGDVPAGATVMGVPARRRL